MTRVKRVLGLVVAVLMLAVVMPSGRHTAIAKKPPHAREYYTKDECDARFVNDGQGEVDGDDIAVPTEIKGFQAGAPVFRVTNESDNGYGLISWGDAGICGYGYGWAGVRAVGDNCPGLLAESRTTYAARFLGEKGIRVEGNLTVKGTKNAVIPMEDGTHRKLTCIESPEVWFEDFGSVQLVNGVAFVEIDPLFLQTVNTLYEYHVFLTPEGDCRGLYVAEKTDTSFGVRELQSGDSSIRFSYRIVAKRRGYETERLEEEPGLEL